VPPPPPGNGGGDNTNLIVGVVVAVVVLIVFSMCCCCIGLYAGSVVGFAGMGNDPWDDWYDSGWYDSGTTIGAYEDWVWGDLKVTRDAAVNVYSTNSSSSTVLETKAKDETFSYYGYDDTFTYYKIKTSSGSYGYVLSTEVEPVYTDTYAATDYKWGEVKVTVSSAGVYSTNSSSSTVLETLSSGTRVDYYGFDDTYNFYRVKTVAGNEGYVKLLDGEIVY